MTLYLRLHVYSAVLWTQWDFYYKRVYFYFHFEFFPIDRILSSTLDSFFNTCFYTDLESRVDQSVSLPNKMLREQHKREVGNLSFVIGSLSILSLSLFIFYLCLKRIGLVLSKSGELAENASRSQVKHYSWLAR